MSKQVKFNIELSVNGRQMVIQAKTAVRDLQQAVVSSQSKITSATNTLLRFNQGVQSVNNVYNGFQQLSGALQPFIAKANAAAEAQAKLTTVMRQRMGATAGDLTAINGLVSAQTKLGVVGGTVQKSGLQQLATFASQRSTLMTLLPAMNNLLVQQRGLSATSEDAVGIANLMGKALMGNATALRRVGITLYDTSHPFAGKEFADVLRALNARQLKLTLKSAYRKEGNKVKKIVEQIASTATASDGPHAGNTLRHGGAVGASAKVRVYSRGGGFMVDARAHGQRGAQYTTSSGKIKPVLMWATEGTAVRGRKGWGGKDRGHTRRKGAYRGRMPKYDIIDRAEAQSVTFVEKDLESEIEAAAWRRAKKMGL